MAKADASAADQAPLAWLAMEVDETNQDGATLRLTLWPSGITFDLGWADFHDCWIRRTPPIWPAT